MIARVPLRAHRDSMAGSEPPEWLRRALSWTENRASWAFTIVLFVPGVVVIWFHIVLRISWDLHDRLRGQRNCSLDADATEPNRSDG